jgi:hypothetical protein
MNPIRMSPSIADDRARRKPEAAPQTCEIDVQPF